MFCRTLMTLTALVWIAVLSGCSKGANAAHPRTLHFGYYTNVELPEGLLAHPERLTSYLSRAVGVPVQIDRVTAYAPLIEAMCSAKEDIALPGPFSYILASRKGCAEPLVVRGMPDGTPATYRSVIATYKNSGIKSIEEMKAQSHRLTLSFNDPASTSGHLVPRAGLVAMGIDPERDFKKVMFSPNHLASALTLKAEKVDIACMMESIVPLLVQAGKLSKDDLRILWTSEPMPTSPIAVRPGLAPEIKARLREAYTTMAQKDPALFKMLGKESRSPGSRYVVAHDSIYDGLRATARSLTDIQLLEK